MKRGLPVLAAACALALGMARTPPPQEKRMSDDIPRLADGAPGTEVLWEGANCAIAAPGERLVLDGAAWTALWKDAFGADAPPVDFQKYFALAVFAGSRPTGGFSVDFLPPRRAGQEAELAYSIRAPSPGGFVIQAFTQPYAVRLYTRTSLPVRVRK